MKNLTMHQKETLHPNFNLPEFKKGISHLINYRGKSVKVKVINFLLNIHRN